jgi:hypothetical protein
MVSPDPGWHRTGSLFDAPNPAVLPRFASVQCQGGTLVVSEIFYLSLRRNAQTRVDAYLAARTDVK